MITDFLINMLYTVVLNLARFLGRFGDVTSNNDFTTSIVTLKELYVSLDAFLPLTIMLAIIAFDLAFEGLWLGYKLARWAYSKIPGVN
jgi:hypothetical protein